MGETEGHHGGEEEGGENEQKAEKAHCCERLSKQLAMVRRDLDGWNGLVGGPL